MTIYRTDASLRQAARQMMQGLASALPAEEEAPSPALTEELILLGRRAARGQVWRRVLAVSPQARAAVKNWLFLLAENRALYEFLVKVETSLRPRDCTPQWLPEGYTKASDLANEGGVRSVLYTSRRGDLLLKCFLLPGEGRTLEIRASGVTDLTGQPTDALPEELTPEKTAVHGLTAHFYRFPENTARYGQAGYLLAFYEDGMQQYSMTLPELSTALVWIDEDTGSVFLLTGNLNKDVLVQIADSIYENGGETT
ncbi:MAG: hypothetical protein BHW35_08005 [Firmicutes bacterium CAG:176_63_11]|nr:MAG: hypothetical protein BHW35_08005 [Firmicutes bacterium CAG:176_63_11]